MILLDEQLTGLKPFLSSLGCEVETVNEAGLHGAPDQQILEYSIQNKRVLVIEDTQRARMFGLVL